MVRGAPVLQSNSGGHVGNDVRLKQGSFGACAFSSVSPKALGDTVSALNVVLTFEEALKLNLALDEAVHQLGRYHRATSAAKQAGVTIVLHINKKRVRVLEGKVASPTNKLPKRNR
jgi:hypothetical protein